MVRPEIVLLGRLLAIRTFLGPVESLVRRRRHDRGPRRRPLPPPAPPLRREPMAQRTRQRRRRRPGDGDPEGWVDELGNRGRVESRSVSGMAGSPALPPGVPRPADRWRLPAEVGGDRSTQGDAAGRSSGVQQSAKAIGDRFVARVEVPAGLAPDLGQGGRVGQGDG